ncbi:ChaN family lipoprotein [Vannielia sp.]|uniref:ChaN family lipoprotein n=1 Tax=Vannielia sp. TaxID=2813045 RepID=UPI0026255C27|nr:ChaN family lipoprotein [Vannielia sp.]MDF1873361.1 ChaN family lipoprotein [Vannielia sp.]
MKRFAIAGAALAALFAFPAASQEFEPDVFVGIDADVFILGELHDNPDHHLRQADLIGKIEPRAVVFEMLTAEQAEIANKMGRVDPDAVGWAQNGWPDFSMYAPVFEASEGGEIYGGMLGREVVRRAFSEPPKELFEELWTGAGDPPQFGLDAALPPEQQERREEEQMEAHCGALPENILPGFVSAQRLRDAALAAQVLAAFEATGGPVVLITGNGHARQDWGVPALLRAAAPDLTVASLGQYEGATPDHADAFQAVALSTAPEREDPCAAFQK